MPCVASLSRLRPMAVFALALTVSLASIGLGATQARATGYGLYFDYAFGDVNPETYALGQRFDTSRLSAGFTMDSAVAKDKLYNYRLNLGYEQVRERVGDFVFAKYNGASIENVFGFGVYRSPLMRVWLGPTLRLAGGVLDESSTVVGPIPGSVIKFTGGGGLAFGVNVHTGDVGSAAFTLGYQLGYNGTFFTGGGVGVPSASNGIENRVNFNFAYYFRGKGDRFEKRAASGE